MPVCSFNLSDDVTAIIRKVVTKKRSRYVNDLLKQALQLDNDSELESKITDIEKRLAKLEKLVEHG